MLVLPGLEQALSQSLEVIREQLNQKGQQFLAENPNVRLVTEAQLKAKDLAYIGEVVRRNGQLRMAYFLTIDSLVQKSASDFETEDLQIIQSQARAGASVRIQQLAFYESYAPLSDSGFCFLGFTIPENIARTKDEVTRALKNYTSVNLLRETIVEQGLVWTIAVAFIILLAVVSVYAAKVLSRGISEPIQKLTDGMHRLGAGDLSHRVVVPAKDEIAFLVDSFNRMAEELKTSRENLQRAERAAAWRDVARQISHEIKNPLTPIQFSLFRVKSGLPAEYLSDNDLKESFRIIEEELASMSRMAEEFSQFARMPHLELRPENLTDILHHSVRLFEGEAHKVSVKLNIEDDVPPFLLDREQFRRAIHNLLKNALEASHPGDSVEVSLSKRTDGESGAHIQIVDHGCGMDEETKRRALEPYFSTKARGSGLGLYIVNRIITDHGGKMHIESDPQRGTTVSILL